MNSEERDTPHGDAESITRLRGEGPRVVRLSRKAIGIASAAGLALVGGALIVALRPSSAPETRELMTSEKVAVSGTITAAPKDYSQVPQLGPPLPGDLGKPILDARDRGAVTELPPMGTGAGQSAAPPTDPRQAARERLAQEREAARQSRLFVAGAVASSPGPGGRGEGDARQANPAGPPDQTAEPAAGQRSLTTGEIIVSPPAANVLQAGSVIPAALITGIRSDQPGLVTAQVSENVHDSLTGSRLLIPQGSRLIGDYKSDTGFGQRRVLLAWHRLIFPDGRSVALDNLQAADAAGYAGLEDRVDYNWDGVLTAASVSTILALGAELGTAGDGDIARALQRGSQDGFNRAGEQIVARELNIRPVLTVRPGFRLRVMVTRDLILETGE